MEPSEVVHDLHNGLGKRKPRIGSVGRKLWEKKKKWRIFWEVGRKSRSQD